MPVRTQAQEDCDFVAPTRSMVFTTLTGGATITYLGGPHMLCQEGIEIWADSAVEYSAQRLQHMMGSVRFIDANGELRADEARYFAEQGRLQASGHVFVEDTIQGFTIENGDLLYLRATDFREEPQMTVTTAADGVRPHAILQMKPAEARPPSAEPDAVESEPVEADSTITGPSEPGSPYVVDGDRIFIEGDDYFRATGRVEIQRDSLDAFADEVEYDQARGQILLEGSARVDGPTYDLVGRTITLGMNGDAIDELRAVDEAVLTGEDLELKSPEIRIYLFGDLLQRLIAVGAPPASVGVPDDGDDGDDDDGDDVVARPIALTEDFELTADSIEVLAPSEVLERIFAGGSARSVSRARDSLNVEVLPEIARNDWLEGDTVIVTFAAVDAASSSATAADSTNSQYRIDRIVARVEARTLYRLPPSDTTALPGTDAPAVHYVLGDEITIVMAEGAVERMEVIGQTRGLHLEPVLAVADSAADSPSTQPLAVDTVAVDTTAVSGARPGSGTLPQEPSRQRDSNEPSGRPHIRVSAAILNPWSGS